MSDVKSFGTDSVRTRAVDLSFFSDVSKTSKARKMGGKAHIYGPLSKLQWQAVAALQDIDTIMLY